MKNGLRNLCIAVWTVLGLVLIAHELGKPAEAQSTGTPIAGFSANGNDYYVITPSGDVYRRLMYEGFTGPLVSVGNIWSGSGPTTVTPQTWSQIKGQYAPKVGGGH